MVLPGRQTVHCVGEIKLQSPCRRNNLFVRSQVSGSCAAERACLPLDSPRNPSRDSPKATRTGMTAIRSSDLARPDEFASISLSLMEPLFVFLCLVFCALMPSASPLPNLSVEDGILTDDPECRDRVVWPFSADSIWNVAIGSDAEFEPALIYHDLPRERACELRINSPNRRTLCSASEQAECEQMGCCFHEGSCFKPAGGAPDDFHNDQEIFVVASQDDPVVPWIEQADWSRLGCDIFGEQVSSIPFPHNYTTTSTPNNNSGGVLMPDRRTLLQMQPIYRCTPGGPLLAAYQHGCPNSFPYEVDILSDGALGSHGGSGLSGVGGMIREGELLESTGPIRHALKVELFAHDYYFGNQAEINSSFVWPATGSDSYTYDFVSGMFYNGSQQHLKPGALVAVPPEAYSSLPLRTPPGKKLLQAFADYGGYIVDDTASNSGSICMSPEANDELLQHYGIDFSYPHGVKSGPFFEDLLDIFKALHVVSNNAQDRPGGGGKPRQPPPPPFCS